MVVGDLHFPPARMHTMSAVPRYLLILVCGAFTLSVTGSVSLSTVANLDSICSLWWDLKMLSTRARASCLSDLEWFEYDCCGLTVGFSRSLTLTEEDFSSSWSLSSSHPPSSSSSNERSVLNGVSMIASCSFT